MSTQAASGDLERAVETVVGPCLGIHEGDDVVIVTDTTRQMLGEALRAAAARRGGEPVLTVMEPREVDGQEPPVAVAAALAAASVFIAPTRRSLSHTRARKAASEAGARGATLPGVTEDMLARLMAADFPRLRARSRRVAALLTEADEAHVTCPLGSDFHVDLRGRSGIADEGDLTAPGAFGNLPCGEGFIAPLDLPHAGAQGRQRGGRPRRDAARRDGGHAGAPDGVRLPHHGDPQPTRGRSAHGSDRGARHLPARHRLQGRPQRTRGHVRRR